MRKITRKKLQMLEAPTANDNNHYTNDILSSRKLYYIISTVILSIYFLKFFPEITTEYGLIATLVA